MTVPPKTQEHPPWPLANSVITVTETVTLKPALTVVEVPMPVITTLLLGRSDAWAQVYIDLQASSLAVMF